LENLAKSAASDQFEELKVAWRKRAFGLVLLESDLYPHFPAYYLVLERPKLVPLVNSMVMDEHWLDLYSAEKEMVCDAVVKIK
jgi:hypothetical protein